MAEESLLPRKELPAGSAVNATDTHAQSSRRYKASRERPDLASKELQPPACLAHEYYAPGSFGAPPNLRLGRHISTHSTLGFVVSIDE